MNFVLFFGGLSMLVGSCVIVCVCNQCKRRRVQKKTMKKLDIRSSVSFVIEPDMKPHSNGAVKSSSDFITISPPKQFSPISNSSASSKDSTDSARSLLATKNSLSSASCLVLPSITVTHDRWSSTHSVIPTIYISSTCTSSSNA